MVEGVLAPWLHVPDEPAPPAPWSAEALPADRIGRIFVTCGARWIGSKIERNVAVGFRLQFREKKAGSEKWRFVEFPDSDSQQRSYAKSVGSAHHQAAIYALETLARVRPDLRNTKVPIELHTEYWEVDRVISGRGWKQLTKANYPLQGQLRQARQGFQIVSVGWGAQRRADRAKYNRQFGKINNRLRRMVYGENQGQGPKFFVNLHEVGALRKGPLDDATVMELLSYHVVKNMGRKGKDLAVALGVPPKSVYNAVNRVDRAVRIAGDEFAPEPSATTTPSTDDGF